MKAKIVRGKSFKGLFRYLLDISPGSKGLKQPQVLFGTISGEKYEEILEQFECAHKLRPEIEKPVWHCSLSLVPGEKLINDNDESPFMETKWEEICREFMLIMGFSEDTPYVVIRHHDKDYDHVHIVACRVDYTGTVWKGFREVPNAIKATQELEKKYGLTITPGYDGPKAKKNLTFNELKMQERMGEQAIKDFLQKVIDDVVQLQPTAPEFCEYLTENGIEVRANLASTGKLNGFSFAVGNIAFKGSSLGKDYSWGGLQKRGVSYEPDRDFEKMKDFTLEKMKKQELIEIPDSVNDPEENLSSIVQDHSLSHKTRLKKIIDKLIVTKLSVVKFCEYLQAAKVVVRPNLSSTGRLSGLSYEIEGVFVKGSSLGKEYSWGGLQRRGVSYELERDFEAMKTLVTERQSIKKSDTVSVDPLESLRQIAEDQDVPLKVRLQRILDAVALTMPTVVEFCDTLEALGIKVMPNLATTGRLSGLSYEIEGVFFKGSSLGKGYSWQGIQSKGVSYDAERDGSQLRSKIEADAHKRTSNEDRSTTTIPLGAHTGATVSPESDAQGSSSGDSTVNGSVGGTEQTKQTFSGGIDRFGNDSSEAIGLSGEAPKVSEENNGGLGGGTSKPNERDDSLVGQDNIGSDEDDDSDRNRFYWIEAIRSVIEERLKKEKEAAYLKKRKEEEDWNRDTDEINEEKKDERRRYLKEMEEHGEEKYLNMLVQQRNRKIIFFSNEDVRPVSKYIPGYSYKIEGDYIWYYYGHNDEPSFVDCGNVIILCNYSDGEFLDAMKLAQRKWNSFTIFGPMWGKIKCAQLSAQYGLNYVPQNEYVSKIFEQEKKRVFEQKLKIDKLVQDNFVHNFIDIAALKVGTLNLFQDDSLILAAKDLDISVRIENSKVVFFNKDFSEILFSREITEIQEMEESAIVKNKLKVQLKDTDDDTKQEQSMLQSESIHNPSSPRPNGGPKIR